MDDDFEVQINNWKRKVEKRTDEVFVAVAVACRESITDGSPITGSPGQPVQTSALKGDWELTYPSENIALIANSKEYAPAVEDGQQEPYTTASGKQVTPRPMQFRSEVGGAHSVDLTRVNFDLLVEDVVARVTAND